MSTLSDVQAFYRSVQTGWTKSRPHVIAHVVFAGVVFLICGATIPEAPAVSIDPKQVSENEWFKLARDTGIIYVLFVIPLILLTTYAAFLRVAGQWVVTLATLLFPPPRYTNSDRFLTPWTLEPIALTLERSDFGLNDLRAKSSELALKYNSQKSEQWTSFQESISVVSKNSQIYLGDFLIFLISWIILFRFASSMSWIQANERSYWPVVFVLSILSLFAWFRFYHAVAAFPNLLLLYISEMVRIDPDMKKFLDISDDKRRIIDGNLKELLVEERESSRKKPSLLGFIMRRPGSRQDHSESKSTENADGWPFPSLYANGRRFEWNAELNTRYDQQWLSHYMAYLYYRLYNRLSQLVEQAWQLTRFTITGAP